MANIDNLKPFTGSDDPRRQNGRKKGSKNLSSIVNDLLSSNIDLTEPISDEMKQYFKNSSTTYAKAIAMAMIIKAINGDVRAANWISTFTDKQPEKDSFFDRTEFYFNVLPDKPRASFE